VADRQPPPFSDGETAADLMLREPKTLPIDATVREARAVLDDPHVQLLLLVDDASFGGAITEIPRDADADAPARTFAGSDVATISPDAPAADAFARTFESPFRRVVVVDEDRTLRGLLCLNESRTRFCGRAR
jgi:CBS domain-containing protein